MTSPWRIVGVAALDGNEYTLLLTRELQGSAVYANASIRLVDRSSRSAGHEPYDPRVDVDTCTDLDARWWLHSDEAEAEIVTACLEGSV